jgi:hypothetical protein
MAHPATGTATPKRKAKGWQGTASSARTGKSPARASKPPKRGKVQSNNPKAGLVRYNGPTLFPDF